MLQDIASLFHQTWEDDQRTAALLVKQNLPKITIVANKTPYRSVRLFLANLLTWFEEQMGCTLKSNINRTCSIFVSTKETIPLTTSDPDPERILREAWAKNGRVTNLEQVLLWHPVYLGLHQSSINRLMREQGPLPLPWRFYLAIVTAARHRCRYLIGLLEDQFCSVGGDPAWLETIEHLPPKLVAILDLLQILVHQPWLLTVKHIEELCAPGRKSWSLGEIVYAIMVISTYTAVGFLG